METLNEKLYLKMVEEQTEYRGRLLSKLPQEILLHAYEYTIREDILCKMEYTDLPDKQAIKLLASKTPLADVYREFERYETDHMDMIGVALENA